MKIVVNKATRVVAFAGDDLSLGADGVRAPGFFAPRATPDEYELLTGIDDLPEDWTGGAYTYVGSVWAKLQWWIDAQAAEAAEKVREQGRRELAALNSEAAEILTDLIAFLEAQPAFGGNLPARLTTFKGRADAARSKRDG